MRRGEPSLAGDGKYRQPRGTIPGIGPSPLPPSQAGVIYDCKFSPVAPRFIVVSLPAIAGWTMLWHRIVGSCQPA
jgi:hypothetical protein